MVAPVNWDSMYNTDRVGSIYILSNASLELSILEIYTKVCWAEEEILRY